MLKRGVGEAVEVRDRFVGERGEVGAGELLVRGSAVLAAAVFGFAA
jgi:hypothetical protein